MRSIWTIATMILLTVFAMLVRVGFGDTVFTNEVQSTLGVDPLGIPFTLPATGLVRTGASVGLLLLVAYLAGQLAQQFRLAAVTGYLGIGILLGPTALQVVGADELPYLSLVNDLAIALIALIAGGEIRLSFIQSRWRTVFTIASIEVFSVLIGSALLLPFVLNWSGITGELWTPLPIAVATICATIAVANSPAVVIAVIAETHRHSSMGRLALAVTICKDLVLVALFTVVLAVASSVIIDSEDQHSRSVALTIFLHLGGSIAAGVVVGIAMAWYTHVIKRHLGFFVVFACFGIALASEALHLEALIVAVVAGLLMQNIWPDEMEAFFEELEQISMPVYCLFFAVAGLRIDLLALSSIWHWALLFVAARGLLVWASTWAGWKLARAASGEGRWLWSALVPQAGIALALASIVSQTLAPSPVAEPVFGFLVAVIAFNQLIGPVLFKVGLARSESISQAKDSLA